jgi:hypothetical protein
MSLVQLKWSAVAVDQPACFQSIGEGNNLACTVHFQAKSDKASAGIQLAIAHGTW